ncbi:protein FAM83H-like [Danio aesculapii]|uniref:protein FAM83H-like n=1 Tax=Danio aesculapii TaxID=1142201 RepID=UPI0024C0734E|nr:protein FAM83H-like [Danio aesculapii]
MAHRSQCSSAGDNPLDPNYLPPHYREEYRLAIDALVNADLEGYYGFLQEANVVDFLSQTEIEYIKCTIRAPNQTAQPERRYMAEDADGSSGTYWPVHSDHDAPSLDLGWPQQFRFVGPTEVTTLVNPSDPEMPSIKEQVRRMIKNAQQVIAVVMDMFTDVDIFADILGAAARGVAVYVLLDELNAHHFVAMVNNCRVNLDEIKCMRVRTVSGSTYFCRTGKTFKGQMMDRFILVDCRAVLSGNYSFMWSFEKIHRCLAHLFLGQLVSTFDEEFRILFAHSEPLDVENVLANMPHYSSEPENYYNTEKTAMFNRQYPTVSMDWPECTAAVHMNAGPKMLPYRSESMHSAPVAMPAPQQYRGDHQFIEHGRPMRGPTEMVGYKRHSYGNLPDFEYMSPQNHPMRGNQYMEEAMSHGGHFAREPHIYQETGLQTSYDMYGKFRGQGHHVDPLSGSGYPSEVDEAEPTGGYDHVQRYLQSHSAMEEGHAPRHLLPPVQSGRKRHSMGYSYKCQTSPTQPNQPEQKRFLNVNRKPQDLSQKQGMRDWRISSYLSTCEDAGELDVTELEGSSAIDEVPCFTQDVPCGPIRPEIRPGNRELNRIPSPRENLMPVQIQNDSVLRVSSLNHPTDLSQINFKSTPTSTSESSCTTEGEKAEEMQNREPKETNRISEEFLKRKPSRPVQRSSRLRHSLIFSSNLELNTQEEMKDTAGEIDGDEALKLSARVSHILDKRRTGSPFQPFQWSNFTKSATFDNSATESAEPEDELSKTSEKSDLENPQNLQKKLIEGAQEEKDLPQTTVPEGNSKRMESPSNVLQKSSSLIDMNDPDCRLRYFKELAAKRKLSAAKTSQNNPVKATQKFALPEKPANNDTDKKAVFKTPDTSLKSKTTAVAAEIKETYKDPKCEESSKDILQRATDAEKIRFKKKLAEESGSTCSGSKQFFQEIRDSALIPVEEAKTVSTVKNQTTSPQNQVSSVAFNAPLKHSAPTQYHIEKETKPYHGVLEESGLPVKLPQTKSMSPISTTPNKDCLSANDSQTLAQSSLCISSTSSNDVSLDSSSASNLAIVDNSILSKSDHRVTSPFPALSTTEVSSAQDLAPTTVGSSQSLNDTEINKNPSQQHISKQPQLVIIEDEPFQKPILLKTGFSQPPLALKPTALSEGSTKLTISTEIKTSQNIPITTKTTDSVQHPALEKGELSLTSTTIKTSSQQPVTEEYSFQSPAETGTDSTEAQSKTTKPTTAIVTDTSAVRTSNKPSQQCTGSDSAVLRKNSSEQPTSAEMDSIESSTSECPPTTHCKRNQSTAKVTESSKNSSLTGTDSSQQPTSTEVDSAQLPNVAEVDSLQQILHAATETDHSQQYTAPITDSSELLTAEVTKSFQQPPPKDAHSFQEAVSKEVYSSQKPAGTEVDNALKLTPYTVSSQRPSATQNVSSVMSVATEIESFQQPAARETDCFQHPTPTEAHSPQQPSTTETDTFQKPPATVSDSCQHPAPPGTNTSQQPAPSERDSSEQVSVTAGVVEQTTPTVTDTYQQTPKLEKHSFQKTLSIETDNSQHPTAKQMQSTKQITVQDRDSSHPDYPSRRRHFPADHCNSNKVFSTDCSNRSRLFSANHGNGDRLFPADHSNRHRLSSAVHCNGDRFSLQTTPIEADSSQQPAATEIDFSEMSTAKETDSTQQTTIIEANPSNQTTATEIDSLEKSTATETDSSQQTSLTDTDSIQQTIQTDTDSSQQSSPIDTDSFQQTILTEANSSLKPTAAATDFFQPPVEEGVDLTKQITVTEQVSSQNISKIGEDFSKHPIETENESHRIITATMSDFADEKRDIIVSKDLSEVLPISHVSTDQLTGLDAVDVGSTQPQVLPEPCLSSNVMNSNQDSTEFQSNISSNSMESSCPIDPKPEKTDECRKNETITMQPQKNDTSAIAPGNEMPHTDISTVIDPNEVDEIKQTSSEKENSVSVSSEVSEKSNLTVTHNSEKQSTVADSPKLILSAHQSSTANVISCSNLRDDTKVLLEQISAKNQSRSTQSKQTLSSPNEAKEGEVKSAYKPLSKYSGRPWSEKATAEEREMLLQKMEKMRKERKVYSRFEAS